MAAGAAPSPPCALRADRPSPLLFVQPPSHWFDGLRSGAQRDARREDQGRDAARASPPSLLRLVLVRCWHDGGGGEGGGGQGGGCPLPRTLDADRCLPYAVVDVRPGAWLRSGEDDPSDARRAALSSARATFAVAEALHDAVLYGSYAAALYRVRSDLGVPTSLVCDNMRGAYAVCMEAHVRAQRPGVPIDVLSCHRVALHQHERRHLSFMVIAADDASAARSVEEWYTQLFAHHVSGSAPTAEFESRFGSLRQTLVAHASRSAWCAATKVVYQSGWASDVAAHAVRNGMHRALVKAEDEAVLLAVSTRQEVCGTRKKTVEQLDPDMQLECVLRVALRTPVAEMPHVDF